MNTIYIEKTWQRNVFLVEEIITAVNDGVSGRN